MRRTVILQKLYSVISRANENVFILRLNPDSEIYKAHFPGRPITPGACVVQIAVDLAEEMVGHYLQLTEMKNVKFLKELVPQREKNIIFTISLKPLGDDRLIILAVAKDDNMVYAKMSFICRRYRQH